MIPRTRKSLEDAVLALQDLVVSRQLTTLRSTSRRSTRPIAPSPFHFVADLSKSTAPRTAILLSLVLSDGLPFDCLRSTWPHQHPRSHCQYPRSHGIHPRSPHTLSLLHPAAATHVRHQRRCHSTCSSISPALWPLVPYGLRYSLGSCIRSCSSPLRFSPQDALAAEPSLSETPEYTAAKSQLEEVDAAWKINGA